MQRTAQQKRDRKARRLVEKIEMRKRQVEALEAIAASLKAIETWQEHRAGSS